MPEIKGTTNQSGYSGLTAADIAAYLGVTFTADEQAQAALVIQGIETFISLQCKRNFLHGDDNIYWERFDSGKHYYRLRNFPVKEITKIQIDGVTKYDKAAQSNELILDTDFYLNDDYEVEFENAVYSLRERNALKIFYTIDKFWSADLTEAIKRFVAEMSGIQKEGGKEIKSYSFAGLSINYAAGRDEKSGIPAYVWNVIDSYMRLTV